MTTTPLNRPDPRALKSWGRTLLTTRWARLDSPPCAGGDGKILPGDLFRIRVNGAGVEKYHDGCAVKAGAHA